MQYGEGNFLRSFADLYFDTLNSEEGGYEVHIVKPIPFGTLDRFVQQNNHYHVILRGMEAGKAVENVYPVNVVKDAIDPFADPDRYYALAQDPELKIIVSNTTEAGICFHEEDAQDDFVHMTYPAKLTLFLYRRYLAGLEGVCLLPVELIDNNADNLRDCVSRYIELWKLPDDFRQWNDSQNHYCNTLVDRIVSGYPRDPQTKAHLEELLGEKDELMTIGEPFGLWVIERKGPVAQYIREDRHNIDVILTEDVGPYKKRKVRILNGSHTNLVPVGLLMGAETVADCMEDPKLSAFIRNTLEEELIPLVPGSDQFALDVMERFRNPFLNHQLTSIALNSISKWKARVLPSFRENYHNTGKLPEHLTLGFSCLMALYSRIHKGDDGYTAAVPGRTIQIQDDAPYLEYFAAAGTVAGFMSNTAIWDEDLTAYPGFLEAVEAYVDRFNKGELPL